MELPDELAGMTEHERAAHLAVRVLTAQLESGDPTQRRVALRAMASLLAVATEAAPAEVAAALCPEVTGAEPEHDALQAALVRRLRVREQTAMVWHTLNRTMLPPWICGAEYNVGRALPFAEVRDGLMAALECGVIDFEGFCAVLIGRYGPDAAEVLPQLLELLRQNRTDCSKAPGLTWAVYQIGGMRPAVRALLGDILRLSDSCPHSVAIARKLFRMNELPIPESA